MSHWHKMPREILDPPFPGVLKARLDAALGSLLYSFSFAVGNRARGSEVFFDGEVKVARPSRPGARVAAVQALLEVLGVAVDPVEEALALAVVPVGWSAGAAEDFEEVLKDVVGGFVGLPGVAGVQDGVVEGARRVVLWAQLG